MDLNWRHSQSLISSDDAKYIQKKIQAVDFVECSARTSMGVSDVFESAARALNIQTKYKCTML